jgi:hypothetical protein
MVEIGDLLDEARKIISGSLRTLASDMQKLKPESEYLRRYKIRSRIWLRQMEILTGKRA